MKAVLAALCLSGVVFAQVPTPGPQKPRPSDLRMAPVPTEAPDAGMAAAAPAKSAQLGAADAGTSAAAQQTSGKKKPSASQVSNPTTK